MNYSVFNMPIESPIRKMWNLATMNPLKQHLVAKYLYFCLINQLNASLNIWFILHNDPPFPLNEVPDSFQPLNWIPLKHISYIFLLEQDTICLFSSGFFWHILRFIFRNLLRILLNRFQISWTKPCSSETRSFDLNEPNLFLFQKTLVHAKNIH